MKVLQTVCVRVLYEVASTKEEGEFYTSHSAIELIIELLELYSYSVYDMLTTKIL